jgi:hypothetical protein
MKAVEGHDFTLLAVDAVRDQPHPLTVFLCDEPGKQFGMKCLTVHDYDFTTPVFNPPLAHPGDILR